MKYGALIGIILLTGCDSFHHAFGVGSSTGNTAPMTVVVDGQSNAERLPSSDLLNALAAKGYTDAKIVNIAVGGTTLRQHMPAGDPAADSYTPKGHGLYALNLPKIKFSSPSIYIWWQGEAEAAYGFHGKDTYGRDLSDWVRDLRAQSHHNFTFVYVKLSRNMAVGVSQAFPQGTPFWKTVRDQQDTLMIPNSVAIDIDDLHGDGLHYYPDEYKIVAERIAAAVAGR